MADNEYFNVEQMLTIGLGGGIALAGAALIYFQRALFGVNAPAAPIPPAAVAIPIPVPPPPPAPLAAVPAPPPVLPFLAELAGADAQGIRTTARLRGMEGIRGHLIARHGPSLSDAQLMSRLTTGLDSEGLPAPTAGVSSRFNQLNTVTDSVEVTFNFIARALRRTLRQLSANIADYAQAEADFVAASAAGVGPAIGAANTARQQARQDLVAAIGGTQNEGAIGDTGFLPVYWSNARQRIELYERYVVVTDHGDSIGSGYHGTQPSPNQAVVGIAPKGVGKNKNMTIYGQANAYHGPLTHTLTVVVVPGIGDRSIARRHDIRNWSLITHYPTGQMAGDPALTPGFTDYSGTD